MWIEGSCHCRSVRFRVSSRAPYPYMRCYCSICRKTAGGGGYAINIRGEAATLEVVGREHLSVYQAHLGTTPEGEDRGVSPGRRHFCATCGSALWIEDPRWNEWVYPFASAIDSELPIPPSNVHMMEDSRANWVEVPNGAGDEHFAGYPRESIDQWHARQGLLDPPG